MPIDTILNILTIIPILCLFGLLKIAYDKLEDLKIDHKLLYYKFNILWKERQELRCANNIHTEDDWETKPGYQDRIPYIACKHCYKRPGDK